MPYIIDRDLHMTRHCYKKKGSNSPPVCGIHNVPLVVKTLPDQMILQGYKDFTFLVCPVSEEVINDE
jgi:hypothetical protein